MSNKVIRSQEGNETWNKYGVCTAAEVKYIVLSPTSKKDAIAAVIQAAPATYGAYDEEHHSSGDVNNNVLVFKEVKFDGYTGEGAIEATAIYESNVVDVTGSSDSPVPVMSFDCGGGTKHMTQAIQQWKDSSGSWGTDDAGGGIGWNGKTGSEAEFAGVDVPTADLKETYTVTKKTTALTTEYKKLVAGLCGKVNSATFKGYAAGEVLFVGMSYSAPLKGRTEVEVTFNFRISLTESAPKISGTTVGSKAGWDYLWARSKIVNDPNTQKPKVQVEGIYKSKVIEAGDFSQLGI